MKAKCPGGATGPCGKVVGVVEAGALGERPVLWFANHRRPGGGNCSIGRGDRVRKADLIHPCKRCAALEPIPTGGASEPDAIGTKYRPPAPRPVKARGYCASHLRDVVAQERERDRDKRRAKHYGLTPARFRQLVDAQGGGCACGLTHSRSRSTSGSQAAGAAVLAVDHDHARQAECVRLGRHGPETACGHCVRGAAGRRCNREILGRFSSAQLRNLADYQDNPTAQRLGWWDDDTTDEQETGR